MPTYIQTPPNAIGVTWFDQHGTPTHIQTPPEGSMGPAGASDPTIAKAGYIFVGSGAPMIAAASGSIYLRTDATTADDFLYYKIGAGWYPWVGVT